MIAKVGLMVGREWSFPPAFIEEVNRRDADVVAEFVKLTLPELGTKRSVTIAKAIEAADTLLLTVPNQLGVDYNAHAIESILRYVAPELGWR